MDFELRHEPERSRFVIRTPEGEGVLAYRSRGDGSVDFWSTFLPPALRGRGLAEALVAHALDWARAEGLTVVPSCGYVAAFAEGDPNYDGLLKSPGQA